MEYLFIYLLQLSESLTTILGATIVLSVISGVGSLVSYLAISTDYHDDVEERESQLNSVFVPLKKIFIISTLTLLISNTYETFISPTIFKLIFDLLKL